MDENNQGLNKYGGTSQDPFDAAKARQWRDEALRKKHFAPLTSALQRIADRAINGYSSVTLFDIPWSEAGTHCNEMMMHLRDRGFKVTALPRTENSPFGVKVEW